MELIKKIIVEELQKVLDTLSEEDLYNVNVDRIRKKSNPKEEIIYDYEGGRAFAGNTLASDITNLQRYNLVEYLPKGANEESWSFEFDTVYSTILIVDIIRKIINTKNYWTMRFGQLYKDEKYPQIIAELENIEGYDKFVGTVNKSLALKMDPTKF